MLKTTKITDPEVNSIVADELERQKYNYRNDGHQKVSTNQKL